MKNPLFIFDTFSYLIPFLHNESISHLYLTNKLISQYISNPCIKNIFIYRKHPLVFNIFDNYCSVCNINVTYISYHEMNFDFCNHIMDH